MSVKLLTEQPLEFLSLKGDWTGSSESTLFKMPHCWKSCPGSFIINSRKGLALYYFKQLTIDLLILSCSND